jgi:hypothetical protein
MIAGRVPAGANNTFHVVCSNPGKPDSADTFDRWQDAKGGVK